MMNLLSDKTQKNRRNAAKMEGKKLYSKNGYNLVQMKAHLMDEGILQNTQIQQLITRFSNIIKHEPNMIQINSDVAIIGDIHGQYFDFMKILTQLGNIEQRPKHTLLFLGDYVDRGANSIEVMTLIMALKVNYPKDVFLLRGNHESRCMTSLYNFMQETNDKYNQDIYQHFMSAFDNLPLACLVNRTMFCVHGGLSPELMRMQQINQINRFDEIPLQGAFCDLIWSDPIGNDSGQMSSDTQFNESRQCSIYFGKSLTRKFLQENSVKTVVRAHEVFPEGFKRYAWGASKNADFPSIITIFSAPNYCGVYGNKGAILRVEKNTYKIKQYKQQPAHKLFRYLEVLEWSIPLLTDVINDFTRAMISSIFHLYLKKDFEHFEKQSAQTKLKVLMNYIKTQTNIQQQQNKKSLIRKQSASLYESKFGNSEKDDKDRMFNRSQQYFLKEHRRPDSKIRTSTFDKKSNTSGKKFL